MKHTAIVFLFLFISMIAKSQDLEFDDDDDIDLPVSSIFPHTRVINGHSTETLGKGSLDVLFRHRFGFLSDGAFELFGLDQASMRLSAEYGLTDRLMIGLGRSSNLKSYDSFIKWKLLQQMEQSTPVSLVAVSGILMPTTLIRADHLAGIELPFVTNLRYTHQLLASRKWNSKLATQFGVVYVHRNVIEDLDESNDFYAINAIIRYKVTKRLSLIGEYHYIVYGKLLFDQRDPIAIGLDIETGGHNFSLHFTNTQGMSAQNFLIQENGEIGRIQLRFGFNLSRRFQLLKPVEGASIK